MSNRSVGESKTRAPRRRASERERALTLQLLIAEENKTANGRTPGQIKERANQRLNDLVTLDPAVNDAVERLAPTSSALDRRKLHPRAALAAALSQPAVAAVLRTWALTPQRRGPIADFSGAVAALCEIAATSDRCDLRTTFATMNAGSLATLWTTTSPTATTSPRTPTTAASSPSAAAATSPDTTTASQRPRTSRSSANSPTPSATTATSCTRPSDTSASLTAPAYADPSQQIYPRSPEHLELLRREGMDLVDYSIYERDGQIESVLGWRETRIIDHASGRTLISTLDRATSHEPHVLLNVLLPLLFELWPDCPMHTIVGDGLYDDHNTCFDLEARWSLHPIFTRLTTRNTTTRIRGGGTAPVCDGQPSCACGPMRFYQREGFYNHEQRRLDGLPRGAMAPSIKLARVRWRCPNNRCKEISTYFTEDPATTAGGRGAARAATRPTAVPTRRIATWWSRASPTPRASASAPPANPPSGPATAAPSSCSPCTTSSPPPRASRTPTAATRSSTTSTCASA